ncbi:DUF746 domain-containing protein [Burkholderia vietnamiensis]|uniref:DUF746 domain-containing protein n=1 Tax=Burkholderia vietnamiensis TaxID=60552 RepID=UPI002653C38C|nr:DUF746 domain-containing protein [Burkholderia vietnamiensis]MDN7816499.1 DUF746 domain-containing protein [Burkholderia vietnamiensis]
MQSRARARFKDSKSSASGEVDEKALRQSRRAFEQALRDLVHALLSADADPVPSCPRCKGTAVDKKGYTHRYTGRLPTYICRGCGQYFNRLSFTPLAHRAVEHIDAFISLLFQPLSYAEAARQLGMDAPAISSAVKDFKRWLSIDATDARHIVLGGRFATVTALTSGADADDSVEEDRRLSEMLLSDFDEIHAPMHGPTPCPACGSMQVRTKGIWGDFPRYQCSLCGKQFNRRTGTPFTRNRDAARQRELIRYLSLPLPIIQLAEMIETDAGITARLIDEFRERCNQLDASGSLASRIRAGAQPDKKTPCVCCGARNLRFYADLRPVRCMHCGRLMSIRREVTEHNGVLQVGAWQGAGIDAESQRWNR